jgi:hypothetical protein
MWLAIIYVCVASVAPGECDDSTAYSVTPLVERYNTQMACALASLQTLAQMDGESRAIAVMKCKQEG